MHISKRKFAAGFLLIVAVFFLCLCPIVVKEMLVDETENIFLDRLENVPQSSYIYDGTEEKLLYIGRMQTPLANTVAQWCTITHRKMQSSEVFCEAEEGTRYIVVDSAQINMSDVAMLQKYQEQGYITIYSHLPSMEVLKKSETLRTLLGIYWIRAEEQKITGAHLFSGFLLGGEVIYKPKTAEESEKFDLESELPWVIQLSGVKTYMVGFLEEDTVPDEELPPIFWRYSNSAGTNFVVNGPYLEELTGIGLLSAFESESQEYVCYPVVNAQSFLAANIPSYARENESVLQRIYGQNGAGIFRDLVWPGLESIGRNSGFPLTCAQVGGLTRQPAKIDRKSMSLYQRMLREISGELALSVERKGKNTAMQSVAENGKIFQNNSYQYTSIFAGNVTIPEAQTIVAACRETESMTQVHTILTTNLEEVCLFEDLGENVLLQQVTQQADSHTYREDLKMRALETVLAYGMIVFDGAKIIFPEDEGDHWEHLFDEISRNMNTYWQPFAAFDKVTVSESAARVREFWALHVVEERIGNVIHLQVEEGQRGYFLLRLHGEQVEDVQGGTCQEVEAGTYLLHNTEAEMKISVEQEYICQIK